MKVLLTGATGYIGRRLKARLLEEEGVQLRLFVRNTKKVRDAVRDRVAIVEGDTFNIPSLDKALEGVDVAYYLIHSMGAGKDFQRLDRESAVNFRDACVRAGVKRIVYLGGLGVKETASEHLRSRMETGEILSASPEVQCLWYRAGVIIGSGSASFEIIRHLVEKLPVMITPRWVQTVTQPVAVDDVLSYLAAGKDLDHEGNLMVDIGSEAMSFRAMLLRAGRVLGLRRLILPVPVLTPRLSSYLVALFTPVPMDIIRPLVEGLRSETLVKNENAAKYFPDIRPMSYEEAVTRALEEIERDQVLSRWCDSSAGAVCDVRGADDMSKAVYVEERRRSFDDVPPDKVFSSVLELGGEKGWFKMDFLWIIRGMMDELVGGYGIRRGRRDPKDLRIGDALDFWKVADLVPGKRLLLLAQMKLPGRAWLEFTIEGRDLVQTAYFQPRGLGGRVYWHLLKPAHSLVFADLGRGIIRRAAS